MKKGIDIGVLPSGRMRVATASGFSILEIQAPDLGRPVYYDGTKKASDLL